MPNISSVTSGFFPRASENSITLSLGSTIAPGATTVPVTNLNTNYSDGDTVVLTVDPTSASKQVFTGQVSAGNVINAVWTEGTNQTHTIGATIIDYVSATHLDLITKGIKVALNNDGTLKSSSVTSTTIADGTVQGSDIASGTITGTNIGSNTINYANLLSTIFSGQVQTYTNPANGGGTFSYINLGGVKVLWGQFTYATTGPNGLLNFTLNFPASFYTVAPTVLYSVASVTQTSAWSLYTDASAAATTTAVTVRSQNNSGGSFTYGIAPTVLAIGV